MISYLENTIFEHSFNTYSYLKSVTEQGAYGEQLNATNFKYDDCLLALKEMSNSQFSVAETNNSFIVLDFNGDGKSDLLDVETSIFNGQVKSYKNISEGDNIDFSFSLIVLT